MWPLPCPIEHSRMTLGLAVYSQSVSPSRMRDDRSPSRLTGTPRWAHGPGNLLLECNRVATLTNLYDQRVWIEFSLIEGGLCLVFIGPVHLHH